MKSHVDYCVVTLIWKKHPIDFVNTQERVSFRFKLQLTLEISRVQVKTCQNKIKASSPGKILLYVLIVLEWAYLLQHW